MKSILIKFLLSCSALVLAGSTHANVLWSPDLSGGLTNAGFTSSSQTIPTRIAIATDENSQAYFGAPELDYILFRKSEGNSFSLYAQDAIAADKAVPLSVTSFSFAMKNTGAGTMTLSLHTSGVSMASRVMEMRLIHPEGATSGNINGSSTATYGLNTAIDIKIYHNNSTNTVDYLFGSNNYSLQSGRYTVFLNNEAVLIDTNIGTSHGASGNGDGVRSIMFNYFGTSNTGEILINDLSIGSFTPIPESSTIGIVLASFALGCVAVGRRRLRHK